MRILVVNAGSSTLKLRVIEDDDSVSASDDLAAIGSGTDPVQVTKVVEGYGRLDAVGHRIVHGGTWFTGPVTVDEYVTYRLRELSNLAPLHQPKSLAVLDALRLALPGIPEIACFDTAFHAGLPASAATYALPREWRERWGLRRFGFHGLSHSYVMTRAAELVQRPLESLRIVTCHLGAGASLSAIRNGRSIDTTMGFTPLEGLVMATRSGSVDPGLLLWLEQNGGMAPDSLADGLEHHSGLLGLAGTGDMREVLSAADMGEPDAVLAIEVYVHRLRAGIAAMTASLGGLDGLVFTGGVGENSSAVRRLVVDGLGFLGLILDERRNSHGEGDREIGLDGVTPFIAVAAAREDLEIAREVRRLMEPGVS